MLFVNCVEVVFVVDVEASVVSLDIRIEPPLTNLTTMPTLIFKISPKCNNNLKSSNNKKYYVYFLQQLLYYSRQQFFVSSQISMVFFNFLYYKKHKEYGWFYLISIMLVRTSFNWMITPIIKIVK